MALVLRHGEFSQRAVEGILHGILECLGVCGRNGVSLTICPLVHIEAVDVAALYVPLFEEVNRPPVHSHGAYGQDECHLFTGIASVSYCGSNGLSHHYIEIGHVVAGDGSKSWIPPRLRLCDGFRREAA